jgi:hypothetical protein
MINVKTTSYFLNEDVTADEPYETLNGIISAHSGYATARRSDDDASQKQCLDELQRACLALAFKLIKQQLPTFVPKLKMTDMLITKKDRLRYLLSTTMVVVKFTIVNFEDLVNFNTDAFNLRAITTGECEYWIFGEIDKGSRAAFDLVYAG